MPFGCSGTRRAFVSAVQLFTRCPNTSSGRAPGELGAIAHRWFDVMRSCGDEVRELLRDGCPVACLGDAPFAYVGVYFTRKRKILSSHRAAGPGPLAAGRREVHAPSETAAGNGHKHRSPKHAHRGCVCGYKGTRGKRLTKRDADPGVNSSVAFRRQETYLPSNGGRHSLGAAEYRLTQSNSSVHQLETPGSTPTTSRADPVRTRAPKA